MSIPKEIQDKFYEGRSTDKTKFGVNTSVLILNGLHKNKNGFVISIVSIAPEVKYLVELDTGQDTHIEEGNLAPIEMTTEVNSMAIDLIEAVLKNEISDAREFTKRTSNFPTFAESSKVAEALHQARHYLDDADIFLKDPAFQESQKCKLLALIEALKANCP